MLYQDEEGNEWFTPIAGWAECSFFNEKAGILSSPESLYPLISVIGGVLEPDTTGHGKVCYLAGEVLIPSNDPYSTAYYREPKK